MAFLVMNMMVGVLVDNYYEVHEQMKEEALQRRKEVQWTQIRKAGLRHSVAVFEIISCYSTIPCIVFIK